MPRVIVLSDTKDVLLDEHVSRLVLEDEHYAEQFIERLGWAVEEDTGRLDILVRHLHHGHEMVAW